MERCNGDREVASLTPHYFLRSDEVNSSSVFHQLRLEVFIMAIYPNGTTPIVSNKQEISSDLFEQLLGMDHSIKVDEWFTISSPARSYNDKDDSPSLGAILTQWDDSDGITHYYLTIKDHSDKNSNQEVFEAFQVEWIAKRICYWDYTKKDGSYAYSKIKLELFKENFVQRSKKSYYCALRNGSSDPRSFTTKDVIKSAGGHVLYDVIKVINGKGTLFVLEGEKDVDTCKDVLRLQNTTTTDNGAKSWQVEFADDIKHYDRIIIVPHNDDAGVEYIKAISHSLFDIGYTEVYVLYLEGLENKGDVTDWVEMGHTKEKFDELVNKSLVKQTKENTPPPKDKPSRKVNRTEPKFWLEPIDNSQDYVRACEYIASMAFRVKHKDWYQIRPSISEITKVPNSIYKLNEIVALPPKKLAEYLGSGYTYRLMSKVVNKDGELVPKSVHPYSINVVNFMIDYIESTPYKIPEVDDVVFRPAKPIGVYQEDGYTMYNRYNGLPVTPKKGDTTAFWSHIRTNITTNSDGSTNEDDYLMFRTWFAKIIQTPEDPPLVFLTLLSDTQGAGRGTVIEPLMSILYGYVANVDWPDILGSKNGVIKDKLILRIEDKPKPTDDVIESVKALVTNKAAARLRAMFNDAKTIPLYAVLLVELNDPSHVIIESTNRRNYVIHTRWVNNSPTYPVECAAKYKKFMTVDYLSAILWDLMYETSLNEPYSPDVPFQFVNRTQIETYGKSRTLAVKNDGVIQYLKWVKEHCQFEYNPRHTMSYTDVDVSMKNNEFTIGNVYQASWVRNKRFGNRDTMFTGYANYCKHTGVPQKIFSTADFIARLKKEAKGVGFELKYATASKDRSTRYNWPDNYDEFALLIDKISGENCCEGDE